MNWVPLIFFLPCVTCITLLHGQSVEAQSLFNMIQGPSIPDCVPCRTCDDFCRKPNPCDARPVITTCDDYCSKPQPCAYAMGQFVCDDYCGKPIPKVCSGCHQTTNYFNLSHQVYDGKMTTIYDDPYGKVYVLQDRVLKPHREGHSGTPAFWNYPSSLALPTPRSELVLEASSTGGIPLTARNNRRSDRR